MAKQETDPPEVVFDEDFEATERFTREMNKLIEKALVDLRELKKAVESLIPKQEE